MVVEIVDVDCVAILETEYDAPVGTHCHGPGPSEVRLQRMKVEAGEVHVVRARGGVEAGEDVAHGVAVFEADTLCMAAFHEAPERPASEAPYHGRP